MLASTMASSNATFCLCVASIIEGALVSGKQVVLNYAFIIICKRKCNVKENLVWYIFGKDSRTRKSLYSTPIFHGLEQI